jgi:TolB protein
VAFASNRAGQWDIWIIDLNGGPPVQVTSSPSEEVHPSWSPDGRRLVYCSLPANGGQWELWITDAEAGGARRFIGYGLFPEWSPVQNQIVFQRARERGSRWFSIWTLTLINEEPRHPTELAASSTESMTLPSWSPDGSHIAFASAAMWPAKGDALNLATGSGVFDIWIMKADGRGRRRLTDGHTMNYGPTFSPEKRIYFSSSRSGQENIWSMGVGTVTDSQWEDPAISQAGHLPPTQTPTARIVAADDGL